MPRETLQSFTLVFREIGKRVLDLLELLDIGEQAIRADQILVDIVEVTQDHIPPEDEFIERLRILDQILIAVVQFQQESDSVAGPSAGDFIEEIVDSQRQRGLDRLLGGRHGLTEIFLEKHLAAPVREYEPSGGDVS